MARQKTHKLTAAEIEELRQDEEFIANLTLDDEPKNEFETSFDREIYDYDYEREDDYSNDEIIKSVKQLNNSISFDSIKLLLPLVEAEYVGFNVERDCFFRSTTPEKPTKEKEDMLNLVGVAKKKIATMKLSKREEDYSDKSMEFEYAKTKYPNAKPFFDYCCRLGVGHMYFKGGCFICQIGGKITAKKGCLGLINKDNINEALNKLKGNLIKFDNDKFIEKAQVLLVHVTSDIMVSDVNSNIKAFSSYLPLRTDKFSVLKYSNGYEILPRGKQGANTARHSFAIYAKAGEIQYSDQSSYKRIISKQGLKLADKVLRLELKLYNYKAIRTYLAPEMEKDTITLKELLNCTQTPILQRLKELEITQDNLIKAKGEYISFSEDKLPGLKELQTMHGLIHLLKLNNYSLDKVRSYLEVETGKNVRSDELKKAREILQRYIACYKPRTVALLNKLLTGMSY
ncbi:MAG: hypothetical protein NC200_07150 [Candidatus Gastranaerophilales bacterium]|nr:hypothetical protein [Candidatus Gastranaerophilales bacterium]